MAVPTANTLRSGWFADIRTKTTVEMHAMDFDGKAMAFSVRVASVADIDALVRLNREVQWLHTELEPTYFKAYTAADEVSAFFRAKLATPGNHIRLSEDDTGPNGYVWFEVQERPETPFTLPSRRVYVH